MIEWASRSYHTYLPSRWQSTLVVRVTGRCISLPLTWNLNVLNRELYCSRRRLSHILYREQFPPADCWDRIFIEAWAYGPRTRGRLQQQGLRGVRQYNSTVVSFQTLQYQHVAVT